MLLVRVALQIAPQMKLRSLRLSHPCVWSFEVTVNSLHPPRLCRAAVFSVKPTFLSPLVCVASRSFQKRWRTSNEQVLRVSTPLYCTVGHLFRLTSILHPSFVSLLLIQTNVQRSFSHPLLRTPSFSLPTKASILCLHNFPEKGIFFQEGNRAPSADGDTPDLLTPNP